MAVFTYLLLAAAILLLLGVISSKASGRLGVPSLLFFLLVGMLAGSEGIGGIEFSDAHAAQNLGVVALIFILFAGGFDTEWARVRPMLPLGLVLATVGVLLTALLVGGFAVFALGFSWREGLLLGSIVSSTDAAAVFAILRSRGVGLRGSLKPLIEFESSSNDPMAIFLTTAMIGLLRDPDSSIWALVPMFIMQMVLGGAAGYVLGLGMRYMINKSNLAYDGLYPVLSIALVLLVYSVTDLIGGNGFLAVYLAGLVIGNTYLIHRRSLMRFHDGLAWLMQIVMFVTLGLLVFPSHLMPVVGAGLIISAFLMFVARPISVLLALLPFRQSLRKIAMVGWVGLRGAVPIILATFPLIAGVERAETIFNLVFFIVLTSVLVQGSTIPLVARWLHVAAPARLRPRSPLELETVNGVRGELIELELPENSPAVGRRLVDLRLPRGALLVLIGRDESFLIPSGSTVLEKGDILHLLADQESLAHVRERIQPANVKV
jgi:cell volume regulation protein A